MDRRTLLATGLSFLAAGPALAQIEALPRQDRQLADQAAAYLQTLKLAKGRFTQTSSRGSASAGTLYINRPGKARFEYDPPAEMLVVSDGRNVSIYDRRLKTFDRAPLGATPLGIFLSRRIRLDDDVKVTRLTRTADGFSITLADARGQTRVRVTGLAPVDSLDPALFVLTDPRRADKG